MTINIGSKSDDWRARACSNFPVFPFEMDGIMMVSVEGFIQGIMQCEGEANRYLAFSTSGGEAKRLGSTSERQFVWWNGEKINFGSSQHQELIERAIRAKFEQNPEAMRALLATVGEEITHDLGKPESPNTSLPAKTFCDILMRIREERFAKVV